MVSQTLQQKQDMGIPKLGYDQDSSVLGACLGVVLFMGDTIWDSSKPEPKYVAQLFDDLSWFLFCLKFRVWGSCKPA